MIYAEIEDSIKVDNSIRTNLVFAPHLTENSNFAIISTQFFGKLNNTDDLILGFGVGPVLRNDEWVVEYLVSPITFLYRKNLNHSSMFYDAGVSAAIMGTIEGDVVLSAFYPEIAIGLRTNKMKESNFIDNLRFGIGYNLIDRSNEYYPNGLIWKYSIVFSI